METVRQEHAAALLAERRARTDELEIVNRAHKGDLADRNMEILALEGEIAQATSDLASLRTERAEFVGKTTQLALENKGLQTHVQDLQGQIAHCYTGTCGCGS